MSSRIPRDFNVAIVACFYPPTTSVAPTTTGLPETTGAPVETTTIGATSVPLSTTPALPPTTTTMNYCVEEKGMNQPLTIQPDQVKSNPTPEQTTPPGDINPTSTTPGLDFTTMNPEINVTLDQPATLTVIYVPVNRPNEPTNVEEFTVVFVYPDGTRSQPYDSSPASSTGEPSSQATTTPSTTGANVPPSPQSPQVDLPTNFRVPEGTTIVITITSTKDQSPPENVCITIKCMFFEIFFTLTLLSLHKFVILYVLLQTKEHDQIDARECTYQYDNNRYYKMDGYNTNSISLSID